MVTVSINISSSIMFYYLYNYIKSHLIFVYILQDKDIIKYKINRSCCIKLLMIFTLFIHSNTSKAYERHKTIIITHSSKYLLVELKKTRLTVEYNEIN